MGLGLQADETGKELPTPPPSALPSPKYKGVGALAVQTGCGKGLNPAFKGDWGWGWDPRHPSPGAQLLGCWFCFSLKSGLKQLAGVSQNRIAYILELKIYGGSNVPVCTADKAGGGPHAHTHWGLCPRTAHTRVCAHTVYINIYIAQVYMLFTVYIYINIKHRYLYVCTIDTPEGHGEHALLGSRADTLARQGGKAKGH